jgi:hypothetical protein
MSARAQERAQGATVPATGMRMGRRSRRLAALVIPVGPAAVAVLRFRLPYATADNPVDVASSVIARPEAQSLVLWLAFVAVLTLVPAVVWVGRLTASRVPRLSAAALLLLVPGYLALSWFASGDLLLWAGAKQGLDPATLAGLYTAMHPTSEIAAGLYVVGHVLGTVLLGVALWRSRTVPRWAAVATIVSQPLHFVAAVALQSPGLDLVAWGMNAVGFAAAGVALARGRDQHVTTNVGSGVG